MWEAVRLYRQVRFVCMGWPDGNQRQSDGTDGWHASGGNQRQSEAIRGNQSGRVACDRRQSEAIRGNQRQSEAINQAGWHAIGGNQRQSEAINQAGWHAIGGNQRQSEAIRGNQRQSIRPGGMRGLMACLHLLAVPA